MRILTQAEQWPDRFAVLTEGATGKPVDPLARGRPYGGAGRLGLGVGDDDYSGIAVSDSGGSYRKLTNKEYEEWVKQTLEQGLEPYATRSGDIKWRRKKAPPPVLPPDAPQQVVKLVDDFRAAHPGVQIGDLPATVDPRMVGDLLSGLGNMSAKYPHAKVQSLGTTSTSAMGTTRNIRDPRWYARTAPANPWSVAPQPSTLEVSPAWLGDYDAATKQHQEGVKAHFCVGGDCSPAYVGALHEFGHVLDHAGGAQARNALNTELRKHFLQLHPEMQGQSRLALDGAYSDWLHEQVPGYGLHPVGGSIPWHESHPWVGKNPKVKLNEPEALAEAFADVEINGERASDASKFLHKRLVDASQAGMVKESRWGGF